VIKTYVNADFIQKIFQQTGGKGSLAFLSDLGAEESEFICAAAVHMCLGGPFGVGKGKAKDKEDKPTFTYGDFVEKCLVDVVPEINGASMRMLCKAVAEELETYDNIGAYIFGAGGRLYKGERTRGGAGSSKE